MPSLRIVSRELPMEHCIFNIFCALALKLGNYIPIHPTNNASFVSINQAVTRKDNNSFGLLDTLAVSLTNNSNKQNPNQMTTTEKNKIYEQINSLLIVGTLSEQQKLELENLRDIADQWSDVDERIIESIGKKLAE